MDEEGCLEFSTILVLREEFKLEKRLRQGDLLAPFFFLILVEVLSCTIRQI